LCQRPVALAKEIKTMETSGQGLWLILLTVGVVVLGLAMAYGAMRNRQRTTGEKIAREIGTKQEYAREDQPDR
jgi:uncharacterized membrane protein YesL